jgi:hypothetical protein
MYLYGRVYISLLWPDLERCSDKAPASHHMKVPALHYTTLRCTALHCTSHHMKVPTGSNQPVLRLGTGHQPLHCTAVHCTVLHCTALHCTVLMPGHRAWHHGLHPGITSYVPCTITCTALNCTITPTIIVRRRFTIKLIFLCPKGFIQIVDTFAYVNKEPPT